MEIVNGYTSGWLIFSVSLAVIPFAASRMLYAKRNDTRITSSKVALALVWFLMFPNIPYLFTKGRYLLGYCGSSSPWELCGNSWEIGFFFLHALVGVPLMYFSIREMATFLQKKWKTIDHWRLAVVMLFVSAAVLPIGLYGRFNSWNLFNQGTDILSQISSYLQNHGVRIGPDDP